MVVNFILSVVLSNIFILEIRESVLFWEILFQVMRNAVVKTHSKFGKAAGCRIPYTFGRKLARTFLLLFLHFHLLQTFPMYRFQIVLYIHVENVPALFVFHERLYKYSCRKTKYFLNLFHFSAFANVLCRNLPD